MNRPFFRPTRFEMQFLGILHRIIKSTLFNISMIILGFSIGFGYSILSIFHNTISNPKYEIIAKIESAIDSLEDIDIRRKNKEKEIKHILELFKYSIIYDDLQIENSFFHKK